MLGNLNNEILIKSYFMNNLFNLGDLVDRTADPSKLALVDLSNSLEVPSAITVCSPST